MNIEGIVGDIHGALAHVDGLGEEGDVTLVVHLYEGPHLPPLLPVPGRVVKDDVRGPDPLPGQPSVLDVVVVLGVPHQEHIVPLGDDLAVGGECLGSLVHVDNVVERHLERDVDHVVRVGGGQDVVPGWVVPQQVHGQLVSEAGERIEK